MNPPTIIAYLITESEEQTTQANMQIDLSHVMEKHPSLQKIFRKYGVNTDRLECIGSGDRGTAYSDGNLVVKVTDDLPEATSAYQTIGKGIPGVSPILFVGKLTRGTEIQRQGGMPEGEPLYLIIQNLANTKISRLESELADYIGDYLVTLKTWPFDVRKATQEVYRYIYRVSGKNLVSPNNTKAIEQLLSAVARLYQHGIKFFDVSGSNIGKDADGNFSIFDLGISQSKKCSLPVVEMMMNCPELPILD